MGNKIISAGSKKPSSAKKEVYVDLDMDSTYIYQEPSYTVLAQENLTPTSDQSLIVTERSRNQFAIGSRQDLSDKAKYRCSALINVNAVQNSLRNLFNWLTGERILLPEYGSNLRKLLYRGITPETEAAIIAEIRNSIQEWEPRVELVQVVNSSTVRDTEQNTIKLTLIYRIIGLSDEQFQYTYEYRRATT